MPGGPLLGNWSLAAFDTLLLEHSDLRPVAALGRRLSNGRPHAEPRRLSAIEIVARQLAQSDDFLADRFPGDRFWGERFLTDFLVVGFFLGDGLEEVGLDGASSATSPDDGLLIR